MSVLREDHLEVAGRLFAAIEAGDVDAQSRLYDDDAVIWHNHDNSEQTKVDNLKVLAWLSRHMTGLRYDEVRRQATSDGFVEQHVLRGEFRGQPVVVPACIVATVKDGRVVRIDEYLDSGPLALLFGR